MCTYHYSISVRLDSNINLLVKLGSVVWLKPDLLTPGIRAKPTNFACDSVPTFPEFRKKFRSIPNGAEDVSTNSERYLRFPNISLEVDKCSGCEAPNVGTTLPRSHLSHLGEITKQCYRKISPRSRAM